MVSKKLPRTKLKPTAALPAIDPADILPRPEILAYARVSTTEQTLDTQITALKASGYDRIYSEKISSSDLRRPEFHRMMKHSQEGDTIKVYAFSRLFRNTKHFLDMLDDLEARNIKLVSLTEGFDVRTAMGRMGATMISAADQGEVDRLKERTRAGMRERMRQGQAMGRPKKLSDKAAAQMKKLLETNTAADLARRYRCSAGTIYKAAKQ